jgi:serine/threonine-protein kinase
MVDDPRVPSNAPTASTEGSADTEVDTIVPRTDAEPALALPAAGYQLGEVIGSGGMGDVIAAHDQRVGREVAIKRMRSAKPDGSAIARFLREARIQARLDHPAIVPVHELGTDDAGRPYFTMKRLTGVTLAERLTDGGHIQRDLRAFVDVCLAIDFAHARHVVHRDLKPQNIMLGDYGEVYVLDWGVARVLVDRRPPSQGTDIDSLAGTEAGALLGTPGYMAPEQLKGDAVGSETDVYALGAILFELLAGQPLHPRGQGAIAATLAQPQQRPSERAPDRAIPPELDALCAAALAEEPAARPTVRTLADRVQAYLDGDRDLEQRRKLAAEQLDGARRALASDAPDARATAMRRAGRAMALDPDSEAAELVTSLVVEPPAVLPAALADDLAAVDRKGVALRARTGAIVYATILGFALLALLLHIRSWSWLLGFYGWLLLLIAFAWRADRIQRVNLPVIMSANIVLAVLWSRAAGPFMLTPAMICGIALAVSASPRLHARAWALFGWVVAIAMAPIVVEWAGLLEPTWWLQDDTIVTRSQLFDFRGWPEELALVVANLVFLIVVASYAFYMSRTAHAAERQIHIQAWHLRQLIPRRRAPSR